MIYIDEYGQRYKAVKKNGEYYLLTLNNDKYRKRKYDIEVKGKQNILMYIKNNKLKKYEELEWLYE